MSHAPLLAPLFWAAIAGAAPQDAKPQAFTFDHENVLGTTLHFEVRVLNEAIAARVDARLLEEIERLRQLLSGWDPQSEFRRLGVSEQPVASSPELCTVLAACESWRERSGGAFHAGVQVFTELWRDAATAGLAPSDAQLEAARARLPQRLWEVDPTAHTVRRLSSAPTTIDALAKGYVIDRACEVAVSPLVVVIGGDLRAKNGAKSVIAVADPRASADNAAALCRIEITDAAVATSGGYARGFDLGGKHYSHILDPRTGRPVEHVLQATVVAPDALTADALATTLNVLAPAAGLELVKSTPGCECLIVAADGTEHASAGWSGLLAPTRSDPAHGSALPGGGELVIDFEIHKASSESGGEGRRGGWRRPYVAAWIEDEHGAAVRTLCLWIEKPRWLSDLRRWSKLYEDRTELADAVTRATRNAGQYQLVWDGRDDEGSDARPGRYRVCIEAVREHGGYRLLQQEIVIDGQEFRHEVTGGDELAGATISFRKPQAAK